MLHDNLNLSFHLDYKLTICQLIWLYPNKVKCYPTTAKFLLSEMETIIEKIVPS